MVRRRLGFVLLALGGFSGCHGQLPPPRAVLPILPFEVIDAQPGAVTVRLLQPAAVSVFELSSEGAVTFLGQSRSLAASGSDLTVALDPSQFIQGRMVGSAQLVWSQPCIASTMNFSTESGVPLPIGSSCLATNGGQAIGDQSATRRGFWLVVATTSPITPGALGRFLKRVPAPSPQGLARQLRAELPTEGQTAWGYSAVTIPRPPKD